jgi:hypothetical protein
MKARIRGTGRWKFRACLEWTSIVLGVLLVTSTALRQRPLFSYPIVGRRHAGAGGSPEWTLHAIWIERGHLAVLWIDHTPISNPLLSDWKPSELESDSSTLYDLFEYLFSYFKPPVLRPLIRTVTPASIGMTAGIVSCPLWIPGMILIVPPVWMMWRRSRRTRDGACPFCGYSLAGLSSLAPCPECGGARDRHASAKNDG